MFGGLRKHKKKQMRCTVLAVDSDLIVGVKLFVLISGYVYLCQCGKPFVYADICEMLYIDKKNIASYCICCTCKCCCKYTNLTMNSPELCFKIDAKAW